MKRPAVILSALALLVGAGWPAAAKPGTRAWEKHRDNAPPPPRSSAPSRIANESDWFTVDENDLGLYLNYTGIRPDGEQLIHLEIGDKVIDMIERADQFIVASVFLFDSFYADEEIPVRDIVRELTELLVARKKASPALRIAVILDPSHRAYGHRVSPSEQAFREAGIDIFYSDLLGDLKRASLFGFREGLGHGYRLIRSIPLPGLQQVEHVVFSPARIQLPPTMDEEPITLEMVYNALLLKANHRKLLVTDVHGSGIEALVSSANPHNPSVRSPNHALSVTGEPAHFIYQVLREDIARSIRLGGNHTHWHRTADPLYAATYLEKGLPALPAPVGGHEPVDPARVRFVSESRIVDAIRERLDQADADDQIRIQMFYLSYRPIVEALARASRIVDAPIQILLDPNLDSFNQKKDGTPNRQAAHWLMNKTRGNGNLQIRWYNTAGEQNHAKTLCITNPDVRRNWFTTGSCNWTGRNMAGINMEANLIVAGSRRIHGQFNDHFDLLWTNRGGVIYSLDYNVYAEHAGYWKWTFGESPFFYSTY